MKKLSTVIITLNEEANLQRCIDSVAAISDEILVVDSHSTDRTVAIAKAAGARVILQTFLGHREQKAFAIERAANDVVLSLDADEALSPVLRGEVKRALRDWPADTYRMNRLNQFMGVWIRHGSWYPERKMRLFDRRQYVMAGQNPHDRFDPAPAATTAKLNGDLLHFANEDLQQRVTTMNKYSTIAARALHGKNVSGSWWRVAIKPSYRFVDEYIVQRGFLDGYLGYYLARTASQYVWMREMKLIGLDRARQTT